MCIRDRSNETQSPARQRIEALLDANSFVEIGARVTARSTDFNLSGKRAPSDGVITGYGVIDGSLVYVYSQDASVLKGTVGEMHAGKIVRLYEMAEKTGAPVIGLVDCAGLRLEEASDALNGFGRIYRAQADASGAVSYTHLDVYKRQGGRICERDGIYACGTDAGHGASAG